MEVDMDKKWFIVSGTFDLFILEENEDYAIESAALELEQSPIIITSVLDVKEA
jgi:hypothetical protein